MARSHVIGRRMKAAGGISTDSMPKAIDGSEPMIRPMSWVSGHHETLMESSSKRMSALHTSRFAIRLSCVTITPRGSLVEPDVYCR